MTTVPQLAQTLQSVFTTTADAAARATGFVQRRAKLTGAACVPALVFGWLANPHASRAALAQAAAVAWGAGGRHQPPRARSTLRRGGRRLSGDGAGVLAAAVQAMVAAEPVAIPLVPRFTAVVLLDCS